jgi:hypothetical protein
MTEAEFLNGALGQIGAGPIGGIDDGTQNANWCKTYYVPLRRALLSLYDWNFAEDRMKLGVSATTPAFGFAFSYTLPEYVIKVKQFYGANPATAAEPLAINWSEYPIGMTSYHRIEGRSLLTNYGQASILFTKDVDNPTIWSPLFHQTLEVWLAGKLAAAINKDWQKAVAKIQEAIGLLMPLGAAIDSQEGSQHPFLTDDLTRVRR